MECFYCTTAYTPGAAFCSACGRSLRPKEYSSSPPLVNKKNQICGGYPHPETLDALVALRKKRLGQISVLCGLAVVASAAAAVFFGAIAALFVVVPALGIGFWLYRISSKDYYALPHARDASGNHRCIFCGNKGIYRKGEYKTNNTHRSCSKCQKHLFTE